MKKAKKKVVKKVVKKTVKKTVKKVKKVVKKGTKKAAKKTSKKTVKKVTNKVVLVKTKAEKPIGEVTHFYNHIRVAIIRFNQPVPVGTTVRFEGATTKFVTTVASMQLNHESIRVAPKGAQVGIKVPKRTREGDQVYFG